ncbi:hypothetical protein [Azospirillum doebereinerae]|uniref:Uncharacterized protein n=1 Tax=Azospirillum doebereinerae TaxID=92933 RepID=A0A3S1CGY5_9PROT|nr:hypothetical protein [Azospirillum doebereinerae]MCG5243205.1 hypothetical protein [Azospirillum doebereinerae]RUQ70761.1 hypothetical protein EJ913_13425 [Azospirillum doebereinerae]
MTNDNRSSDRQDLDAMTREFLAKGGKISQCAPGSSDNVVYRKGTFRRRPAGDGKAAAPTIDTPAADAQPAAPPQPVAAGGDSSAAD